MLPSSGNPPEKPPEQGKLPSGLYRYYDPLNLGVPLPDGLIDPSSMGVPAEAIAKEREWRFGLLEERMHTREHISSAAKHFMLLWTKHVDETPKSERVLERQMPNLVRRFTDTHALRLALEMRNPFIAHLCIMAEHNLLHKDDLQDCLLLLEARTAEARSAAEARAAAEPSAPANSAASSAPSSVPSSAPSSASPSAVPSAARLAAPARRSRGSGGRTAGSSSEQKSPAEQIDPSQMPPVSPAEQIDPSQMAQIDPSQMPPVRICSHCSRPVHETHCALHKVVRGAVAWPKPQNSANAVVPWGLGDPMPSSNLAALKAAKTLRRAFASQTMRCVPVPKGDERVGGAAEKKAKPAADKNAPKRRERGGGGAQTKMNGIRGESPGAVASGASGWGVSGSGGGAEPLKPLHKVVPLVLRNALLRVGDAEAARQPGIAWLVECVYSGAASKLKARHALKSQVDHLGPTYARYSRHPTLTTP